MDELEQFLCPLPHRLAGQIEVASVDEKILLDLEILIEVVLLGNDADVTLDLSFVATGF